MGHYAGEMDGSPGPNHRAVKKVSEAPKDGSNCWFHVALKLQAFWCDDAKRWVLTYPLNLEYLPTQADHMPGHQ